MFKIFSNFRDSATDPAFIGLQKRFNDYPITFFYDYIPLNNELSINDYNIISIHEPNEFFGMHDWVLNNNYLFDVIFTWNDKLLKECENAVLFHHNTGGMASSNTIEFLDDYAIKYSNKKFEVSFLSGAKTLVEGHKLRQEIYKAGNLINIPKKWFYVLDDFDWNDFNKGGIGRPYSLWEGKQICFTESMFHIAVENVKYRNWYTEKICDAFASKTVPIYWGCENFSDMGYDERGILKFNSVKELIELVNSLTPEMYENMKPYIDYNFEIVKLDRFEDKLYSFIDDFIKLNSISNQSNT